MADLATLDEVQARLDWEMDEDEQRMATGALADASEWARYYSKQKWVDPALAPRMACVLVLKAVLRLMKNPDGTVQSRAGDETLGWSDRGDPDEAGLVRFTSSEIATFRSLGGAVSGGIQSASITAWGSTRRNTNHAHRRTSINPEACDPYDEAGYVPVVGSDEKPFPYFADPDGAV